MLKVCLCKCWLKKYTGKTYVGFRVGTKESPPRKIGFLGGWGFCCQSATVCVRIVRITVFAPVFVVGVHMPIDYTRLSQRPDDWDEKKDDDHGD